MMLKEEKIQKMKTERAVCRGTVKLIEFNHLLREDVLVVFYEDLKVHIPRSEVATKEIAHSLIHYLGDVVSFQLVDYRVDQELLVGSIRQYVEANREDWLQLVANYPELAFEGTVKALKVYGALIDYQGFIVVMMNEDFSDDYVTIREKYEIGDRIAFKLKEVKSTKIEVRPLEKYQAQSIISFEDFKEDQIVLGQVNSIKGDCVFTRLAEGLDALSPMPLYFTVKEGDIVKFKVNQVRPEERRIRGKIVKVLDY